MGALVYEVIRNDLSADVLAREALWPDELDVLGCSAARVAAITVSRAGADPSVAGA